MKQHTAFAASNRDEVDASHAHSLGTKIHSSTYNSRPTPAQKNSAANSSRHIQASIPVERAIPPHTPPNHRSVRLRRKLFTTDANWSFERVCSVLRSRSF